MSAKIAKARRIVSLVPSLTELLYDLGLDEEVVGITKFCVRPQNWFRTKTRVGGTKDFKLERISALLPDLIIANKEENDQEDVEALQTDFPVLLTDIKTVDDALAAIQHIGERVGRAKAAARITKDIHAMRGPVSPQGNAAYLIWRQPYMVAGGDTFISSMLQEAGFRNAYGHLGRYPAISLEELGTLEADFLLLSSEPFPFREKHAAELAAVCPDKRVLLVDGEMFSWYGSRMLRAYAYFRNLREGLPSKEGL